MSHSREEALAGHWRTASWVATATSTFTLPDSLWVLFRVDLKRFAATFKSSMLVFFLCGYQTSVDLTFACKNTVMSKGLVYFRDSLPLHA